MKTLDICIVSWTGLHDRATAIASSIRSLGHPLRIVYSDEDPAFEPIADCEMIRRPNELFWGDKFETCLRSSSGDLLLIIHADCDVDDWPGLISRYLATMTKINRIGVWAPIITRTPYALSHVRIADFEDEPLTIVTDIDALVFCLLKPVQERMKRVDYRKNVLGWGINNIFSAFCLANAYLVVVDQTIEVSHTYGAGYDREEALKQRGVFLSQLTMREAIMFKLMQSHLHLNQLNAEK